MSALPSGTVTFLFTDIEGSTARWEHQPDAMRAALARHDALLRAAIHDHHGQVVKTMGDAFHAVFVLAANAVAAALDAQRRLQAEPWGEVGPIRVRMAVHTDAAEERDGDYYGPPLNRVARLMSAGPGGQSLLSQSTYELVRDTPPDGVTFLDLGEHRLKDLIRPERVFQLSVPDLPADFPPILSLDSRPHNLPIQPTPLIGREREVRAVHDLLAREDIRLVTLTGPGGTGKTRLGLQVAAELTDQFPDGVYFVALAPIANFELVAATIAQALDIRDVGGRPILDSLKVFLRERRLLLLLDNFEQILSAAPVVSDLLAASASLQVLVTSRAALHLRGEHEYPVPPLELPPPHEVPPTELLGRYPAIALFMERATAIKPDLELSDANAPVVLEICRRVDALPLALELAAARVKLLPLPAMLSRLERRLPLLVGGAWDLPTRQQTLRDTIAWSVDLLGPDDQRLFTRLAVFVGGASLAAVEAVCANNLTGDFLEHLASLVDKSLLVQTEQVDGEPRFGMLETIREFASDQLEASGEAGAVRRRHAEYILKIASTQEARRWTPRPLNLSWFEREHDNLRAAIEWSTVHAPEIGARLIVESWRFWHLRGHASEGRRRVAALQDRLLSDPPGPAWMGVWGEALRAGGTLAQFQGDLDAAQQFFEQGLRASRETGHTQGVVESLMSLGTVARERHDVHQAASLLDRAVSRARELDDPVVVADALMYRGLLSQWAGDYGDARSLLEESLAVRRQFRVQPGLGPSLSALGYLALAQGDLETARACFDERLALWRDIGDPRNYSMALCSSGSLALATGDYHAARAFFDEGFSLWLNHRADPGGICWFVGCLAALAVAEGQLERAARLAGAATILREQYGSPTAPSLQLWLDRMVESARPTEDRSDLFQAWIDGRGLSLERAIEYARSAAVSPSTMEAAKAPVSTTPALALTEREREVAMLVAQGLTSREIAEQLVISHRTADTHVDNIRSKLGLQSRAQLAAWAVANGLLGERA